LRRRCCRSRLENQPPACPGNLHGGVQVVAGWIFSDSCDVLVLLCQRMRTA
jgi:hypothetical protein